MPLIKGAIRHPGAAFIDCISPCVAFNNHEGSTKSYDFVREHNEAVNRLDVIIGREPIIAEYAPGEVREVAQHDGSVLRLRKLHEGYDPTDRLSAMAYLQRAQGGRRDRHRPALRRPRTFRHPRRPAHRAGAAEPAGRRGALPRRGGPGGHQRRAALTPSDAAQAAVTGPLGWCCTRCG